MTEYYLGIDVGYAARRRNTGLCLITVDQANFDWRCLNTGTDRNTRLRDLRALMPQCTALSGVGIDGPLVQGLCLVNCYRAADALLNRGLFMGRCNPAPTNSGDRGLHRHAAELANLVLDLQAAKHITIAGANHPDAIHQSCIIEAFPNAFLAFLLSLNEIPPEIPRNQKSDAYWEIAVANGHLQHLIAHLAPARLLQEPLQNIEDHDHRAAFICALSAMCVAKNEYVAAGAPGCGDITLPPREVWRADDQGQASWAETTLRANVNGVRQGNQRGNPCPNFNQARVISNGQQWMP